MGARAVVVIGMHRTGTSLVANLLHHAMGVRMGERFLGAGPWNRTGVWEDLDFVQRNRVLLRAAGAVAPVWRNVPPQATIDALQDVAEAQAATQALIARKADGLWGWKDPRTCLTVGLYAPYLHNPVYVVTQRDQADTIRSLEKRGKRQGDDYWRALIRRYEETRDRFLERSDARSVVVRFEQVTDRDRWQEVVAQLADGLGVEADEEKASEIIKWR